MITHIQINKLLTYLTIAGFIVFGNIASYGQGKTEEVTIIAPYIPSIGDATKIPFRPEINPAEQETPAFKYEYVTRKIESRMELDPVEPMKYSEGEQEQLYRNYAKLGYGNYITPYLDFMASSLQSEKYQFGARIKHHSSQGKIKNYPPSAYSHNLISVFGRTFSRNHGLSADIGYKRDVVHFYGFTPDNFPEVAFTKDDLKQRFQHIHGTIEFGSNFKQDYLLNHFFRLSLHHYTDFYDTRESQISFLTKLDKAFKTSGNDFEHEFALDLGVDFLGYQDTVSSSNPLFFLMRPVYRLEFSQYRFEAGLSINIAGENSPLQSTNAISVFPILKAEVVILENQLKAFAEVSGSRTINSFRSITGINPFISSTPLLFFTDEKIRIGGGIAGNAGGMNFLAEASYSYLMDMPLYVTDNLLALQNKFDVVYDDINLLKIKASVGYVKMNQLSVRLLAAYYHYIPQDEDKAWQMPNYEIGFDAGYTFQEKYTLRASMLALGSRYAKTFTEGQFTAVKMSGALDIGAGFEYQVNRMLSAYIDVNNILNQNYQRWYQYPVQGILVMAGVKLSF